MKLRMTRKIRPGPTTSDGARTKASPTTPPSPVGSGQAVSCGNDEAKPAAKIVHRNQAPIRSAVRSNGRWLSIRQPHTATGINNPIAPRPRICIARSAPIAPG